MQGHIDKLTKNINFDIDDKPIGAVQWDFICSIPEAHDSLINNYNKGPESLFVYLTDKCSLNCHNCIYKETGVYNSINFEDLKNMILTEQSNRLKYIILDGDPILYEDFDKVIDLLVQIKMNYSINTLMCPSEDILKKVAGSIAKIQFRLSNLDDSPYLQSVVDSLELCRKYNIYTAIIFTINEENHDKTDEMVEFCKKHNVKQFSFSRLDFCPNTKTLENHTFISNKKYLEISKKLVQTRDQERDVHITSNDALWKGCGACNLTATIYPDGSIYPCAYLKIKCGDLKDGIKPAWQSEVFNNIRISNLEGKCKDCKYKLLCKGCRAVVYAKTGNYLAEDDGCWL